MVRTRSPRSRRVTTSNWRAESSSRPGTARRLRHRRDAGGEPRSADLLPDAIEMMLQLGNALRKPALLAADLDEDLVGCGLEQPTASIHLVRGRRAPVIARETDLPSTEAAHHAARRITERAAAIGCVQETSEAPLLEMTIGDQRHELTHRLGIARRFDEVVGLEVDSGEAEPHVSALAERQDPRRREIEQRDTECARADRVAERLLCTDQLRHRRTLSFLAAVGAHLSAGPDMRVTERPASMTARLTAANHLKDRLAR